MSTVRDSGFQQIGWCLSGHVKAEGRACHTLEKEASPSVALQTSQVLSAVKTQDTRTGDVAPKAEHVLSNGEEAMDSVSERGEKRVLLGAS